MFYVYNMLSYYTVYVRRTLYGKKAVHCVQVFQNLCIIQNHL